MTEHSYKIDFFQLSLAASTTYPTIRDGFEAISNGNLNTISNLGGYIRDLWGVGRRRPSRSWTGQFRKFRMDDLPEFGRAGQPAQQLTLAANSGLVERNFFVVYEDFQILGWINNGHGSTAGQFARFLEALWGNRVDANPVIQGDAVRRLLRGGIEVKRMIVTIPRPTNPNAYPNDEFGHDTISLLNRSGADGIHLVLTTDSRRADSGGSLAARMKRTLSEFARFGATTARAIVNDGGFEHPIDLLADRITNSQTLEHDGRYPPAASMFDLIDRAKEECGEALREYFGEMDNAID